MKLKAYAKVNLSLDVVGKRDDGYHDLRMVMVPIDLHDVIDIEVAEHAVFRCTPPYRIRPEKNTLLKTIDVCRQAFGFKEQFHIHLHKHIPSQAGLGGGSSDAAAILNYLNTHFGWNLSDHQMIELGLKIGADVPFCLFNRPAIVTGIGEKLEFFTLPHDMKLVLVQPSRGVSTKLAFSDLDYPNLEHPNIAEVANALKDGDYVRFLVSAGNSMEPKAISLVPEIDSLKKRLVKLGCDKALMTGSGSVVMGFSRDDALVEAIASSLKPHARFVRYAKVMVGL
jgi:4-diphosphocytidyl-2-C-methyl-D-erythritol kinase